MAHLHPLPRFGVKDFANPLLLTGTSSSRRMGGPSRLTPRPRQHHGRCGPETRQGCGEDEGGREQQPVGEDREGEATRRRVWDATRVKAIISSRRSPTAMLASDAQTMAVPEDLRLSDATSAISVELAVAQFVSNIRSGSFVDIGLRRFMEDEHICIDDVTDYLGSMFRCPTPNAFYGLFNGHGGADTAAYIKKHVVKLFFEDANFPQTSQAADDDGLL